MALFYNKAVFDQYGIAVPTTWDEYVAAAKKLHAADPTTYITNDTGDAGFTTSMIWQAGGQPFPTDGTERHDRPRGRGHARSGPTPGTSSSTADLLSAIPRLERRVVQGPRRRHHRDADHRRLDARQPRVAASPTAPATGASRRCPTYDGTPVSRRERRRRPGRHQAERRTRRSPPAFLQVAEQRPESRSRSSSRSGGFPSTTADLESDEFLAEAPEYFGGQKINEVLAAGREGRRRAAGSTCRSRSTRTASSATPSASPTPTRRDLNDGLADLAEAARRLRQRPGLHRQQVVSLDERMRVRRTTAGSASVPHLHPHRLRTFHV